MLSEPRRWQAVDNRLSVESDRIRNAANLRERRMLDFDNQSARNSLRVAKRLADGLHRCGGNIGGA